MTTGICTFVLLALVIRLFIRRALRPIGQVEHELSSRDGAELASEIGGGGSLPTELSPLVDSFNSSDAGSQIRITAVNGGSTVKFSVSNQSGLKDASTVHRVFEPFWRADKARGQPGRHAGLGLSICKKLVDIVGGTISAQADDAGAFCVTVELPASA